MFIYNVGTHTSIFLLSKFHSKKISLIYDYLTLLSFLFIKNVSSSTYHKKTPSLRLYGNLRIFNYEPFLIKKIYEC